MRLNIRAIAFGLGILWGAIVLIMGMANLIWSGYLVKVLVEHPLTKRMDVFQPVGVDKNFVHCPRTSLNGVGQFTGGAAVKITDQLEVNAVTVLMKENSEIAGHDSYSFGVS